MRIAYVCYWNAFRDDGIAAKIRAQAAIWKESGHEAQVFCLSRAGDPGSEPTLGDCVFAFGSTSQRVAAGRSLARAVAAFAPEVVYLRYDLLPPTLYPLLRRKPVVVEVQTNDLVEFRQKRRSLYNRLNRRFVLGRAAGIVCVSGELARLPGIARFRKPTAVIANGAVPDEFRLLPPADNERPRLAFLGSERFRWHGIDKIRELAKSFPEFDIDFVGPDPARLRGPLPSNVKAHGFLPRSSYEPILARADVGVGTLALHRKGMEEASPLKVREYLLYGLPVIIGYEDTDFVGEDPWFLLRLPNTETNVRDQVDRIRSFVERVKGRRVPRELVEPRLDARGKEAERLAFMREVLATRAAR